MYKLDFYNATGLQDFVASPTITNSFFNILFFEKGM